MYQLDKRIDQDPIRRNVALVLLESKYKNALEDWTSRKSLAKRKQPASTVGRGEASDMIDDMLSNMHTDWNTMAAAERAELRAKFHNAKRYGKRWLIMVERLGPGILFIFSGQLCKMV